MADTFYDRTAQQLGQAARLLLQETLPPGVRVREAHVAYFYRQSFEVIFRALATHAEANALVASARVAVHQGAGKQIAQVIMLMQDELLGSYKEQDGSEDVLRAVAWEQAVDATELVLGDAWPEGNFPNFFEIAFAHHPRNKPQ